jgi:hypothetical protein
MKHPFDFSSHIFISSFVSLFTMTEIINKCMKFMAKTTMYAATFRDVSLALEQGTIVDSPLTGMSGEQSTYVKAVRKTRSSNSNSFLSLSFFFISSVALLVSLAWFSQVRGEALRNQRFHEARESLIIT